MMIQEQDIQHLAKLARLKLRASDIKKYQKQISEILDYVAQLKQINTENVEPCTSGVGLQNVMAKDESLARDQKYEEELLNGAPSREGHFIKTKGVFE